MNRKIIIIGIDGVPWKLLYKLIGNNTMPYLAQLINSKSNVKATLRSILPPYTPPAWTSIATGVNPGKHGVFDFHIIRKTRTGFVSRLATSLDVLYPRLHDMLEFHRLKSIVYNLPLTYPPWIAGGKYSIVINDWMAPEIRMHPKSLENKYLDYFNKGLKALDLKGTSEESFEIMAERLDHSTNGLLELMDNVDWNLVFTVFSETDWCLHANTNIIRGKLTEGAYKVFKKIDWFIGKAMEYTENIMIVSDHGFTLCPYILNVPYILKKYGLSSDETFSEMLTINLLGIKKIRVPPFFVRIARKHKRIKYFMRKILFKVGGREGRERRREVPYSLTKILTPDAGIIYVAPGYKDQVENILSKELDIKAIYEPHELYWGPYIDRAPDLILEPVHDYCLGISTKTYKSPENTAHHRDGVFILKTEKEIDVGDLKRLSLWDIAPIALYLLNLPIPHDTDCELSICRRMTSKMNYLSRYKLAKKLRQI